MGYPKLPINSSIQSHSRGLKTHSHFGPKHSNHNLTHNNNTYGPIKVRNFVPRLPKTVPNFHHFSPKFWDLSNGHARPHTIQIINKALKPKINRVEENPYLPKLLKLHKTGTHVKPFPWGATLSLGSWGSDGLIAENSRDKVELLSLKSHSFLSPRICSSPPFSSPLPTHLVKIGTRDFIISMPHVQF